MIRRPFLFIGLAAAAAVAILTAIVVMNPYLPIDATVERDIQATNLGPLTATFPFFTWLGGPGGIPMQAAVVVLVLLLNRRAWILALAGLAGGLWYEVIVNLVNRPRPTVGQVLRITEHPGSTSYPSGHLIFITISAAILMLCIGHRYLPRWARPIGWAVVVAIVVAVGLDRIYAGVHWPSDVLAGILIATAWLSFVLSIRWITDRAFASITRLPAAGGDADRTAARQPRFLKSQALNVPIPMPITPPTAASLGKCTPRWTLDAPTPTATVYARGAARG
jgi:membrane-associated phospholipid phosphatase